MRSQVPVESRLHLAPDVSRHASFRGTRHRQTLVVRLALAGVLIGVVLGSAEPSPTSARTIRWTLGVNQTCGVVK